MTQLGDNEREEKIALLILVTGWNRSCFERLTDEEIAKEYERVVK